MDCDEAGVVDRYERETGRKFPQTYTTQTRPNTAPWKDPPIFISTQYSCAWLPKQVTSVTRVAGYDLKGNGGDGYVAAAGSVRDGEPIVVLSRHSHRAHPRRVGGLACRTDTASARTQKSEMMREQRAAERAKREQEPSRPFAVARGDRIGCHEVSHPNPKEPRLLRRRHLRRTSADRSHRLPERRQLPARAVGMDQEADQHHPVPRRHHIPP